MKNLHCLIPLIFLFSCFISLVLSFSPSQTHLPKQYCLDDQRSSLVQLRHDLYYASSSFTFSSKFELWDPNTDCCSWEGVTCDALGHVIELDLSYKNLSGCFHSIFHLHYLHRLNLAGNNFNSTLLSYVFGKLPNLTHLNLSSSCFHGQIPLEISYLTRLVYLDLSNQDHCYWGNDDNYDYDLRTLKLEKPNLETLTTNLKYLKELYLNDVDMSTQSSKWCKTVSLTLSNLRVLSLSNCGLEGPLCSSLSTLTFLSKLVLDYNPISSLPPNFLEISSHLISLSLVDCNLSGHFPTEILLLPKIQSIDISDNDKLMGQLPEFSSNNALRSLSLSATNFSGKLPESIRNLQFLTDLTLSNCYFFGSVPSSIANLSHLVNLDLLGNSFSGLIPRFHRFGVPNLANLDLGGNKLSGSIPFSLFTLPSLQTLFLDNNQLVGKMDEFPNASSSLMEEIRLVNNYLTGSFSMSILQLPRLEWLYIDDNSFSSLKLNSFFHLHNLRGLGLSNVSLLIESDGKNLTFSQLEKLFLRSCNLTEFPEFIKTLDKLTDLDLSNNHIHGVVPHWLWKSSLSWVDLSFNSIGFPVQAQLPLGDANLSFPMLKALFLGSCNLSAFPEFLRGLENLEILDLSNNSISGAIPSWVCKKRLVNLELGNNHISSLNQSSTLTAPICNSSQLAIFDASYNNLSGPIPNCLGNMSALFWLGLQGNHLSGIMPEFSEATLLQVVQVNDNRLEGKLPTSLAECTQLQVLDVGNNMMHDTFPFWLEKLPYLTVLILRENRFYGQIKHLKHKIGFPSLDVLDIASNQFSGELSYDFLEATQLRSLKIGGNKLEGKLPTSLANCIKLEVLDLGNNMIHDTFPFWLEKLPSLKVLILRGNKFYGTITKFDTEHGFPNLRILDIASNNFSGDLTIEFLHSLKAMMQITNGDKARLEYIGGKNNIVGLYYHDSVTIVNKGVEMFYEKVLTILTCLDLSHNSFYEKIPEEIHILMSLKVLNLSHNSFSGEIPSAIGNLKEIESLDLSQNKLSGKIPPQLTSLTFLAALNLSYNQFGGSIPQSNQFTTFTNDSFRGNPKLCGPPLSRKCNEVGIPMPTFPGEDEEDTWLDAMSTWKIALVGYGSGLLVGLCIGYTVLNELGNKWADKFKKHGKRNRGKTR